MPVLEFKTVADELLHIAEALHEHLSDAGYDVEIEKSELGFPFTPTFTASRGHEVLIVELASALDDPRLRRWAKFCRSQSSDTRFCAVVSQDEAHTPATSGFCLECRIGLWTYDGKGVVELRDPVDLAIRVDLPEMKEISPKLRKYLASPFKKIGNGEWRDGLSDIYVTIEDLAREYLKNGIERTRIVSIQNNGDALSVEKVDKLTLGQLSYAFANIANQNQQDSLIANTLALINPTRVKLTHKRLERAAEESIRNDVGRHVYAAINCLEEILK